MVQHGQSWPHHVRIVGSVDTLITTPFVGAVNALCWPRQLSGDFQAILDRLPADDGITSLEDDDLLALDLSGDGAIARDILLADQALMRRHGLQPSLDCIHGYSRDAASGPIVTDVYSFHVDRAPVPADTYLCTYIGRSSEGLANASAVRRVDEDTTRAELLRLYGGADDAGFATYLAERSYDLHFAPCSGAVPYLFGTGNLWRIAIAHPDSPVAPCIHRAPPTLPGEGGRLLMIS